MGAYTTIDDPSAYFQTALYSGNGGSNAITFDGNSDMQPDWVWIKCRANASTNHYVWDSSRGVHKYLSPSQDAAEGDDSASLTAFGSDGFTMGDGGAEMNHSDGRNYVGWGWKANGGTRVTNTESGNNPAGGYQVNTTSGFSIVDYTGTGGAGTMAHGLGAIPEMIIVKERPNAQSWYVYHHTLGNNTELYLNNPDASASPAKWNSTTPTSSVFSLAANNSVNQDATNYIAYCFKGIRGYSKFGSYKGNGATDGTFTYTGFKVGWLLVKNASTGSKYWHMWDTKRSAYNVSDRALYPNAGDLEDTGVNMDLLSNGFKTRISSGSSLLGVMNTDGDTYIYAAFADNPFVSSEGVPCTAR